MENQTRDNKKGKPYRRPKIKQVRLVPEQVVLGGCKLGGSGQADDPNCGNESGGGICQL